MVSEFINKVLLPGNTPNRFTVSMGELIRNSRKEAGFTQKELSEYADISQSTLSKMENGKVEPTASELVYLSDILGKPISYFFPKQIARQLKIEEQKDELMNELFIVGSKLGDDELRKVIAQIRALVEYEEKVIMKH